MNAIRDKRLLEHETEVDAEKRPSAPATPKAAAMPALQQNANAGPAANPEQNKKDFWEFDGKRIHVRDSLFQGCAVCLVQTR